VGGAGVRADTAQDVTRDKPTDTKAVVTAMAVPVAVIPVAARIAKAIVSALGALLQELGFLSTLNGS
jgi:hypothetical protein